MNILTRLEDSQTEIFSTEKTSTIKSKQNFKSKLIGNSKRSNSSSGSYVVDYGPIRVRHRRNLSQTLATGRRPKDEPVYGEEAIKRELRREKNRIAARDLKKARDQIELDLIQKIKDLEQEKLYLQEQHKKLEELKAQLNRAVYNAKQAPLIPFVTDMNIPILFEPQKRHELLNYLQSLLKVIDEQSCISDC